MPGIKKVDLDLMEGVPRGPVHETDDVQVMRIRLEVGESLPHHNSNANVLLVPLCGSIRLDIPGDTAEAGVGSALGLPYGTPMDVANAGSETACFLVIKTPHPKTFA